jgi:hypothetical protein
VRPPLRILFLALLLTSLLTASGRLPSASADPDPTPEPTPTPSPNASPPPEPSPDPEPTETPTPSPSPPDPTPSPSPSPSPDDDGEGKEGDQQSRETGGQRKEGKRDPFALGGPRNTAKLVSILTKVIPSGMSLEQALLKVVGPFPVAGLAWWSDDWHAPRCCPSPHLHHGLDIFAPIGTPLVAAANGYITQKVNSPITSGLGLEVTDARGVQYFYAHLSSFAPGIEVGTRVDIGQVVGYVGDTGNARGTIPHVHFEYQPDGIPAPPKPHVDRWLKIAERNAKELVREITGKKPKVERLTFRLTRLFDLVDSERTDLIQGVRGQAGNLLILTGLYPAANYQMARDTAGTMSWEIDWGDEAANEISLRMQGYQQEMAEQTLMGVLQDPSGRRADAVAQTAESILGLEGVSSTELIGTAFNAPGSDIGEVAMVPEWPQGGTLFDEPPPPPSPQTAVDAPASAAGRRGSISAESEAAPISWASSLRTAVGPIVSRTILFYGPLSQMLQGMGRILWNEVMMATRDEGPLAWLRSPPARVGAPLAR